MSEPYKVLFLDIDGVLNCHEIHPRFSYTTIDRDKAERLNRLLDQTGARIVLISAWRYLVHDGSMTLKGLQNLLLSHWIPALPMIGITREDITPNRSDRGPQIKEWLHEHRGDVSAYVVIDDLDLEITEHGLPFIHVDGEIGLTDAEVLRAEFILCGNRPAEQLGVTVHEDR